MRRSFPVLVFLYFLSLFLAGCLAPLLFYCVQILDSNFSFSLSHYLASKPLCQYVDRLRLVIFLSLVLKFVFKYHLYKKWNLFHGAKTYLLCFIKGCCLWLFLFGIIYTQIGLSTYESFSIHYIQIFLASFCIAFLEEIVFRGFCFDFLSERYSIYFKMFVLSFIFAILHFSFCSPVADVPLGVQGLVCASQSIFCISNHFQVTYFFCLFFLGIYLTQSRCIYGTLWSCIGFHQGLVFTLMILRKLYPHAPRGSFWGCGAITDTWFSVLCLLFLVIAVQVRWRRKI